MTNNKNQELMETLEKNVTEFFNSERYTDWLDMQAKFYNYSYSNTVLIASQCRDASRVAGYGAWKKIGRQVKKGEKAIKILAPMVGKKKTEDENGREKEVKAIYGFKAVNVFDVAQTEGEELPTVVTELEGNSEEAVRVYTELAEVIKADNIGLTVEDTGSANGYYSPMERRIAIGHTLSHDHALKTLIHEYSHALTHYEDQDYSEGEVIAESVAYIVSNRLGIESGEYSFGYVAVWSGNQNISKLKKVAGDIQKTAKKILEDLGVQS